MRIDFVITELNVGGAEKALTEIALGMQERGHQVRVLGIGNEPRGEQDLLRRRLIDREIPCHFGRFEHWSKARQAVNWLRRKLQDDPPAILQSFLFHANCLGTLAARLEGVQRIIGGLRVAEPNRFRGFLERRAVCSMSELVCVSNQVRQFAIDSLRAPSSKCVVIPNGVDGDSIRRSSPFDWTELGWPADSQVALFVGRLHPQKGLDLVQDQAESILRSDKRKLVLIGEGPLRDPLTAWAKQWGDRIRLLPWQSRISPFLRAARVLVLPSRYEGMPNVVLEAMAAGRPVVCSRVEGTEEIFQGGDPNRTSTQLFPIGDGVQMAQLLDGFFDDPQLCERIGRLNQTHVGEHFSLEAAVTAYADLYETPAGR